MFYAIVNRQWMYMCMCIIALSLSACTNIGATIKSAANAAETAALINENLYDSGVIDKEKATEINNDLDTTVLPAIREVTQMYGIYLSDIEIFGESGISKASIFEKANFANKLATDLLNYLNNRRAAQ